MGTLWYNELKGEDVVRSHGLPIGRFWVAFRERRAPNMKAVPIMLHGRRFTISFSLWPQFRTSPPRE